MDAMIGGKDNVDPSLLINSQTDFSNNLDILSLPGNTDTDSTSQQGAVSDTPDSPIVERHNKSRNGRNRKSKNQPDESLTDAFLKLTKEEKEARIAMEMKAEERAIAMEMKAEERAEKEEKREEELLSILKITANAIDRLANSAT